MVRGVGLVAEVGVLGLRGDFVLGDGAPTGAEGFLADLLAELVDQVRSDHDVIRFAHAGDVIEAEYRLDAVRGLIRRSGSDHDAIGEGAVVVCAFREKLRDRLALPRCDRLCAVCLHGQQGTLVRLVGDALFQNGYADIQEENGPF